ncbi:extracellular solute-binding protein [Candidatus Sumerlaeota bacterium]|nr:extracellular solute-binding protein [Candidatus Sumerlaeota bacterium]
MKLLKTPLIFVALLLLVSVFAQVFGKEVVVYTALDRIYSEQVLREFEKATGINVKSAYDTEATKTTGLVMRLIAERNNPQADVFWTNEVVSAIVLKNKDILAPYISPNARDIPPEYKDPEGYWTGFGARARIIIYNTRLVKSANAPQSIFELTEAKWKGQVAVAKPLFGTTASHFSALYFYLGREKATKFFNALKKNEVKVVDGNAVVKDMVAMGKLKLGLTDTDDALMAIRQGKPVRIIFPDREGMGTFFLPNSVSLIKGCRHPVEGKRLIDYLLSPEVEQQLVEMGAVQFPLHPGLKQSAGLPPLQEIRQMKVSYQDVASKMEEVARYIQNEFLR